jgi:hypothetical protein
MINLAYIARMAPIWRARPASGRYIMHRLPRGHWCRTHGPVTRYHACKATCSASGFKCLPGCSRAECEGVGK